MLKPEALAGYIDHTLLATNATEEKIVQLCGEARQYGFASVCVNSCCTAVCASLLADTKVNVCTVVGFPLGAMKSESKAFEASQAIADGAREIDIVINVAGSRQDGLDAVERDIPVVKEACGDLVLKSHSDLPALRRGEADSLSSRGQRGRRLREDFHRVLDRGCDGAGCGAHARHRRRRGRSQSLRRRAQL